MPARTSSGHRSLPAPTRPRLALLLVVAVIAVVCGVVLTFISRADTITPPGMRVLPDPLYGVTLDNDSGASSTLLAGQTAALRALPHMPTARLVFDAGMAPSDYVAAVSAIQPVSYILGLPVDSSDMTGYSLQQYHDRFAQYLSALGSQVDLWEVGNEVNGNWTGVYSGVSAKIYDAYSQVKAAGKRSELTLYYNPNNCDGPAELDPIAFTNQYVPADMRTGLDYVMLSYYETQCNNYRPSASTLTSYFQQLHALYPNAKLGFGEVGLPMYVTSATQAQAQDLATYYYGLNINLPYYVGGYFWWGFAEDAVPTTKPLWQTLVTAMTAMPVPVATVRGDINGDGRVNVLDLSALLSHWGTSDAGSDLNHDGSVNVLDLSVLLSSWTG